MTAKDLFDKSRPLEEADLDELTAIYFLAKDEYYNGQPSLSDQEFDKLEEQLKSNGLDRITSVVGTPVLATSKFIKRLHPRKMLSLDKIKTPKELNLWADNTVGDSDVVLMFKYDGLALRLQYSHGILTQAVTRGDGSEGEDVIENVKLIPTIPHQIDRLDSIDIFNIYGEAYMLKPVFAYIFENKGYKNPRNAVAGVIRTQDDSRRLNSFLTFTPYDCDEISGLHSVHSRMNGLRIFGFLPPHMIVTQLKKLGHDVEIIQRLRDDIQFEIDGIVARVNDDTLYTRLGVTSHHPKGMIALKFEAKGNISKLIDVVWQTGPTGEITPVAIVSPVVIDGVTIERVNLHNYTFIEKMNLDKGCEVEIIRANDVIPQIIRRIE